MLDHLATLITQYSHTGKVSPDAMHKTINIFVRMPTGQILGISRSLKIRFLLSFFKFGGYKNNRPFLFISFVSSTSAQSRRANHTHLSAELPATARSREALSHHC